MQTNNNNNTNTYYDSRLDKHEILLEKIIEQQVRSDELIKMLSKRTEQHDEEIKNLKQYDIDVGKLLVGLSLRLSVGQWVFITAVGAGIVGLVTFFISTVTKLH
jgi:hypothetical protein